MFSDAIFPGPFILVAIIALLAILIFEIAMFLHVINNKFITSNAKLSWVLGMILLHPIVAIVYYFTDFKKTN